MRLLEELSITRWLETDGCRSCKRLILFAWKPTRLQIRSFNRPENLPRRAPSSTRPLSPSALPHHTKSTINRHAHISKKHHPKQLHTPAQLHPSPFPPSSHASQPHQQRVQQTLSSSTRPDPPTSPSKPPSLHTKPIIPFPQRLTAITTPNPLFPNLISLISFFGLAEGPNEWGGVDEVCRGGGDVEACATELGEGIGGDFEGVGEAEEGF